MKTQLALTAVAAAIAVFSQGAFAQASSPTRAEVKAQARSGSLAPAGEGAAVNPSSPDAKNAKTTKTRSERKSETKMARDAGSLKPAGEADKMKDEKAEKSRASTTTRADRKAETKAAVKAGATTPAGEADTPGVPQKK